MEPRCRGPNLTADLLSRKSTGLNSGVQESKLYNPFTFVCRKHQAHKQVPWQGKHTNMGTGYKYYPSPWLFCFDPTTFHGAVVLGLWPASLHLARPMNIGKCEHVAQAEINLQTNMVR